MILSSPNPPPTNKHRTVLFDRKPYAFTPPVASCWHPTSHWVLPSSPRVFFAMSCWPAKCAIPKSCSCFQCPIVGDKIDHQISTWTNISSWSKAWGKKNVSAASDITYHPHHHSHPSSWNTNPKMVKSFNGSEFHHQFLHMFSLQIQKQQHVSPKSSESCCTFGQPAEKNGFYGPICKYLSSWWCQPIWKICSSKWIISPIFSLKMIQKWNHHLFVHLGVKPTILGSPHLRMIQPPKIQRPFPFHVSPLLSGEVLKNLCRLQLYRWNWLPLWVMTVFFSLNQK